jgi:hypothetical protein
LAQSTGERRRVHLERHHLGRARAERRLDQRHARGADHLRRHLGGVRGRSAWDKLDVVTYSWQKVLGGEGGHGMLILGPARSSGWKATRRPGRCPKIFRLTKGGKLVEGVFQGETINTPSMLAVEDYIWALEWAELQGGSVRADRARRRQCGRARRLGAGDPLGRASRRRSGHAQQHQRVPALLPRARCPASTPMRRPRS